MEALFNRYLVSALNLTSTSYSAPKATDNAVIPPYNTTASWFTASMYDEKPAGGYYTSLNDMRKIGKAMMKSTQLDPSVTRRWMKPHSLTSNTDTMVGAPWEILRAPGSPYTMMMTKGGDIGVYAAYITLIPELGVGFSILAAGESSIPDTRILADMMAATFVPATRDSARQEAKAHYEGDYSDAATGSNMTLALTDNAPGIAVSQFTYAGQDVIGTILTELYGSNVSMRLYPTGLSSSTLNGTSVSAWRAIYQAPEQTDFGAFSEDCWSWIDVSSITYGKIQLAPFHLLFSLSALCKVQKKT